MVMEKITFGEHELSIGVHPALGLVVYDEKAQGRIDSGQGAGWVRLFKLNEFATGKFIGSEVHALLTSPTPQQINESLEPIKRYLSARERTTGCYKCAKVINTIDFSICIKCNWVRCTCGACGCGYKEAIQKKKNAEAIRREKEDAEFFACFPPRRE